MKWLQSTLILKLVIFIHLVIVKIYEMEISLYEYFHLWSPYTFDWPPLKTYTRAKVTSNISTHNKSHAILTVVASGAFWASFHCRTEMSYSRASYVVIVFKLSYETKHTEREPDPNKRIPVRKSHDKSASNTLNSNQKKPTISGDIFPHAIE